MQNVKPLSIHQNKSVHMLLVKRFLIQKYVINTSCLTSNTYVNFCIIPL